MFANSTLTTLQPVVERYITSSDGVQIYAKAVGQSHLPSLVLAHGLACSALIWATLLQNSELLKQFYLVAYDLRGHGRSGQPTNTAGYASQLWAEDFANVAQSFNLTAPVFVGWSYGGTVVADIFAHLGPDAISGIVYTAALPYLGPVVEELTDPFIFNEVRPGLLSFDNATAALDSRKQFVYALVNDDEAVPTEEKWAWLGAATLVGPSTLGLLFGREQDPQPLLEAAAAGFPTLSITGGRDRFIQAEPLRVLLERNFTNLITHHIPEGSHAMFYDFQDEYATEVIRFATSVFNNRTSS